jgi:hypothetical protein
MSRANTETTVRSDLVTAIGQLGVVGLLAGLTVFSGTVVTPGFVAIYGVVDLIFGVLWYRRLLCLNPLARWMISRWIIGLTLPVCLVLLLIVLRTLADPEVRSDVGYQVAFVIAWGAALLWAHFFGHLLGLAWLEQGLERRNLGAVSAGVGLTLGTTLAVAGANIGEGPTMGTTIGPMFLAVGALVGLWGMLAAATGNTSAVTVERDRAAGLRLAALLVTWGMVLGRSVAGNWVSVVATLWDFLLQGLIPGLVLLGLSLVIEVVTRPTRQRPTPGLFRAGVLPSGLYLILGLGWLWHLGVPS